MAEVQFAREAPCKKKTIPIQVGRGFSFFDFREDTFDHEMDPLGRLLSQVRRLEAGTMYLEKLSAADSADMREENEDLGTRYGRGTQVTSEIVRMAFFRPWGLKLEEMREEDFLGYIIVKTDFRNGTLSGRRVYESVLKSSRPHNNFVRRAPVWRCLVQGRRFKIQGFLYAQQNSLTNVCAHVALRTCAAVFHPEGDMTYREINRILGIDHKKNWVGASLRKGGPARGLGSDQMVAVMNEAGARCIDVDYDMKWSPKQVIYQRYVYGSIESGYPAMLVFDTAEEGVGHTVPVFGHTMNQDLWVPNAEQYFRAGPKTRYLPSDLWLASFIVHDDNWGSNFCCPKHFLKPLPHTDSGDRDNNRQSAPNHEWLARVIATLPAAVKLSPLRAEALGAECLFAMFDQLPDDGNKWRARLQRYADPAKGMVVMRTLLISADEYAEHLRGLRGWKGARIPNRAIDHIQELLGRDELFWMVEFSVPELFSANLRKLGEVILRSSKARENSSQNYMDFLLSVRLPGWIVLAHDLLEFDYIPAPIQSHVRVFGLSDTTKVVA
ncbi:MAG: hypothetical protein B7Z37_20300 [Verrucomicrobia bacterium 12-59-8]|nr:MAG: hypothetical protein B7Z37_20300 [Verrucomicrobia bacterium 12-59-8]